MACRAFGHDESATGPSLNQSVNRGYLRQMGHEFTYHGVGVRERTCQNSLGKQMTQESVTPVSSMTNQG